MTQISRPFQIALAAVVLLAAVWFVALRGHSSSGGSSSSTPAASAPAPAAQSAGGASGSPGQTYTGSAPGVAGLTRAIAKAQGAVKQSEQNGKQLQQKAAQAEGTTQPAGSTASSSGASAQSHGSSTAASTPAAKSAAPSASTPHAAAKPHAVTHPKTAASATSKQTLVEGELKAGHAVIVLFWSPKGGVDVAVHRQLVALQAVNARFAPARFKDIAVHYSSAAEVGEYGTITRSLQILQTPTLLVISPSGKTKTLTGLIDAYAIEQAIVEALHS